MSTDVCDLSEEKKAILMNAEVLGVHKDPLYVAGKLYKTTWKTSMWKWRIDVLFLISNL